MYREFDRQERPEDDWKYDDSRRQPERGRSGGKGKAGLVVFLLLLIVAGVGAYLWFFTDLYYVAAVKLERTQVNMFVGEDVTLAHQLTTFGSGTPGLEWSSTDPAVASVDGEGAIQAHTPGSATITLLEPASGLSAQCQISVHSVNDMVLGADELTGDPTGAYLDWTVTLGAVPSVV